VTIECRWTEGSDRLCVYATDLARRRLAAIVGNWRRSGGKGGNRDSPKRSRVGEYRSGAWLGRRELVQRGRYNHVPGVRSSEGSGKDKRSVSTAPALAAKQGHAPVLP
jgi:hypothetical protein